MQISVTVEGIFGLNWPRWKKLVQVIEQANFYGLYCSDHFVFTNGPDADSLEVYTALTYLADHSQKIKLGTLVSPLSFRNPVMIARQAMAINDLSVGRMILGVGTGWEDREHHMFGYPLGDVKTRMDRMEEGLQIIRHLTQSDQSVTFEGEYFQLHDAMLHPRSTHRLPLLIGGNGKQRTLPLVARYADLWNAQWATPNEIRERNTILDDLLVKEGRQPSDLKRTMIRPIACWRNDAELQGIADAYRRIPQIPMPNDNTVFLQVVKENFSAMIGTPDQVIEELKAYEAAGIDEIMLQYVTVDSVEQLEIVADSILPHFNASH